MGKQRPTNHAKFYGQGIKICFLTHFPTRDFPHMSVAHFAPFRRFIDERESWPRAKERSELGTQQLGDSDSWAQGAQLGTMFRSECVDLGHLVCFFWLDPEEELAVVFMTQVSLAIHGLQIDCSASDSLTALSDSVLAHVACAMPCC